AEAHGFGRRALALHASPAAAARDGRGSPEDRIGSPCRGILPPDGRPAGRQGSVEASWALPAAAGGRSTTRACAGNQPPRAPSRITSRSGLPGALDFDMATFA